MSLRLLKINSSYDTYVEKFMGPSYAKYSYEQMKEILDQDGFLLSGSWSHYLRQIGYDAAEIYPDIRPLQVKWARQRGVKCDSDQWRIQIAIEQVKAFQPEVIWSISWDMQLLRAIRSQVPSVRLVFGWMGSDVPALDGWDVCDCVLSCYMQNFRPNPTTLIV